MTSELDKIAMLLKRLDPIKFHLHFYRCSYKTATISPIENSNQKPSQNRKNFHQISDKVSPQKQQKQQEIKLNSQHS
jgi:hypothetical protein